MLTAASAPAAWLALPGIARAGGPLLWLAVVDGLLVRLGALGAGTDTEAHAVLSALAAAVAPGAGSVVAAAVEAKGPHVASATLAWANGANAPAEGPAVVAALALARVLARQLTGPAYEGGPKLGGGSAPRSASALTRDPRVRACVCVGGIRMGRYGSAGPRCCGRSRRAWWGARGRLRAGLSARVCWAGWTAPCRGPRHRRCL